MRKRLCLLIFLCGLSAGGGAEKEGAPESSGEDPSGRDPVPPPARSPPRPPQTVTLDLKDMDVAAVLAILSRQTNLSMVWGDDVVGRVTVLMKGVEFWEALRIILAANRLAYILEGQVLTVLTAGEYEKLFGEPFRQKKTVKAISLSNLKAGVAKDVLESFKSDVGSLVVDEVTNTLLVEDAPEQIAVLEKMVRALDVPQETRRFTLNYAVVDDLLAKVAPLVSKNYGSIQSDKRSNTLVVRDNPQRVREIADIVAAFDMPHKTVLIEAKIVQVNLTDEYQWGINWQRAFSNTRDPNPSAGGQRGRLYSGVVVSNTQILPLADVNLDPANGGDRIGAPGITANITSLSGLQVSAALNFLETLGNTKLLSAPRIMALNNQEARIHVGSKEVSITRTLVNPGVIGVSPITTETPTFVDVGIKLTVTPTISEDGYITMKIKPEVNAVERTVTTASGSSIPIVRGSEAETSVRVKDGVTIVIGGLIEERKSDTRSGVPILSRIPVIGALFRSMDKSEQKTELIIFLTPHIVTGDADSLDAESSYPQRAQEKRGFFRRLFGGRNKKVSVPE